MEIHMSSLLFKHFPPAFRLIFFVELWERFGFYGIQAIFVLFMVQNLKSPDAIAENLFSAFIGLAYAFMFIGGWIGDKLIGTQRTLLAGAITLLCGYTVLFVGTNGTITLALSIIIAGNTLFKANPSTLVAKLFPYDNPKAESAFTLYYMSINLGSFASMLLVPYLYSVFGFHMAFGSSVIGLILAILAFILKRKYIAGIDSPPGFESLSLGSFVTLLSIIIGVSVISMILLSHLYLAYTVLYSAAIIVLLMIFREVKLADRQERKKLIVCLLLIIEAVGFYILYQQMPTSLNLFVLRCTDHMILGFPIEPAAFQSLNPVWIIIVSPIMAYIFSGSSKYISLPSKFALGMFFCAFAFLSLGVAASYAQTCEGIISGDWVVITYFFLSIGELLISGLGLAMIAKLAPQRSTGFMMGAWFISQAIATIFGGFIAAQVGIHPEMNILTSQLTNNYSILFLALGSASLFATLCMAAITPMLNKKLR